LRVVKIAIIGAVTIVLAGLAVPFLFPRPMYIDYGPYLAEAFSEVSYKMYGNPSGSIEEYLSRAVQESRGLRKITVYYNDDVEAWIRPLPDDEQAILLMSGTRTVRGNESGYSAVMSSGRVRLLTEEEARLQRKSLRMLSHP